MEQVRTGSYVASGRARRPQTEKLKRIPIILKHSLHA